MIARARPGRRAGRLNLLLTDGQRASRHRRRATRSVLPRRPRRRAVSWPPSPPTTSPAGPRSPTVAGHRARPATCRSAVPVPPESPRTAPSASEPAAPPQMPPTSSPEEGPVNDASTAPRAPPACRLPGRALRADARGRADRRPQDAAAEVVLRRRRQRAVREDHRAARVLPDPGRAGDPRRPRAPRSPRPAGARTLVELGSGSSEKTRLLLDALRERGTLRRYVPVDVSESALRDGRDAARRDVPRARGARAWSPTSPRTWAGMPGAERPPAGRVPRRHDRQPAAGRAGAVPGPLARRPGARRRAAARHRPGQGPGGAGRGLRRRGRGDRRVQQERAARRSTASSAPTSTPTPSSTSRCGTPSRSGSRCGCGRPARRPCGCPPSA